MAESDAFPPSNVPAITSAEAAVAAVTAVHEKQRAEADKRIADSEIVDPGQKHATPESEPGKAKPDLVLGASTSESHPESLIERALAVGYDEAEAREMSVATLRKTVGKLEQRAESRAPRAEPEPLPDELEEYELPPIAPGEETEYDPKYLEAMSARDKLLMEQRKELTDMKRREQERVQTEANRQHESAKREFERLIAADEELHDELGDGSGIPANQKQLAGCEDMWALMRSLVQKGKTMEQAYKIARQGLFHEKLTGEVKAKATKDMADKLTVAARQHSKKPAGGKQAEKPFGKERAAEELARLMAQRK